jgi:hypothetical protein
MQKYVDQLIEDLEKAKGNKPDKPNVNILYPDHPALDYGLDYIAEWECTPRIPMAELTGLDQDNFPPADKLTETQMEAICDKILQVWQEFNLYADFPEGLPAITKYQLLRKRWGEDVQYISEGNCHLEFCEYDHQNCPFGIDYCQCKDLDHFDMDNMTPQDEKELPS